MNRNTALVLTVYCLLAAPRLPAASGSTEQESQAVAPEHLKWLDVVTYIITERERDAFLNLTDRKARDQFVDIFWKARDPTPGSTLNEFKEEHLRRIAHADKFYGRETARDGWKTDRGRIYILLGKPRSVSRFVGQSLAYESELWSYGGLAFPGVPPFLNLLFYRHDGVGEFKLYVPGFDKPTDLLAGNAQMNTPEKAFELLSNVDPELALASLSIRPGETGNIDPNRSSFDNMVVNRIVSIPERTVDTSYVSRLAAGSAAIELEYSFNYTPMSCAARAYYHPGAGLLVDYALEIQPQHLTLVQYEDKIYTTLDILGAVKDGKDRQLAPVDEQAELLLKPEELERLRHRPMNFHSRVVGGPGALQLSLLLKSQATKQYARADLKLSAEDPEKVDVWASEPLLCYRTEADAPILEGLERAFQFGSFRAYPRVSAIFGADEKPLVYVQLYSRKLSVNALRAGQLRLEILDTKGGAPLRSASAPLQEAAADTSGRLHAAPALDLSGLPAGNYELRCSVLEAGGKSRLSRRTSLAVSPAQSPAPPWLLSRGLPSPRSSAGIVDRARSSLALDQPDAAINALEGLPVDADPVVADVLLQAYAKAGKPQKIIDKFSPLLAPVLYSQGRMSFQKALWCEALIDAHMKLGQWQAAQGYLERLAQDQQHRPDVWFKLATCHSKLGRAAPAEEALRKACALDGSAPGCPGVK